MWAIARFDLQLPEKEFWQLTPRQFEALSLRMVRAGDMADFRSAQICALLNNIFSKRKRKPKDFMPGLLGRGGGGARRQTPEEMLEVAKRITLLLGGKVSARLT